MPQGENSENKYRRSNRNTNKPNTSFYYGVENDCRNFCSNHMDSLRKSKKNSKNDCFLAIFGLILVVFLTSQSYEFDAFAHAGAPLGVE